MSPLHRCLWGVQVIPGLQKEIILHPKKTSAPIFHERPGLFKFYRKLIVRKKSMHAVMLAQLDYVKLGDGKRCVLENRGFDAELSVLDLA